MGVARQAPAPATGRLVGELKAKGEEKGEHKLKECLAIIQQANVGGFILEINGDSAVVPRLCGCCGQCVTPQIIRSRKLMQYDEDNTLQFKTIVQGSRRYH